MNPGVGDTNMSTEVIAPGVEGRVLLTSFLVLYLQAVLPIMPAMHADQEVMLQVKNFEGIIPFLAISRSFSNGV